jgi:hypothetical protein
LLARYLLTMSSLQTRDLCKTDMHGFADIQIGLMFMLYSLHLAKVLYVE